MYQTIEAVYDDGKIYPISEKIGVKKTRVLLTILDDNIIEQEKSGASIEQIKKIAGTITSFNEDALEYQRRIRNEW